MLETLFQRFRGLVFGTLLVLLSVVFLLQFGGPQQWSVDTSRSVAEVYGERIGAGELHAAFMLAGGDDYPAELAQRYRLEPMLLLGLVERSLLAREARRLGMTVSENEVLERVAEDGIIHVSMSIDAEPALPRSGPIRYRFTDSDGKFDKKNLKNFIEYRLRRSVSEFARSQIEETLAQRMRETVIANVVVAPGEVWDAWVREKESVTLGYARFSPVYYAKLVEPSEAELVAWRAANAADVDAEYEKQKHRYTGLEKQVRSRHILIKVAEGASDEEKATAKATAEGLRARALAGEDFASLAREHSEDAGSRVKGGDLGFNPKGRMVAPFDEAQFALAPGSVSEVVESSFGFHVIQVVAVREGDVPVEEAKRELAEQLYRTRGAATRAEEAAKALQAKLREGMPVEEVESFLSAQATPVVPAPPEGVAPKGSGDDAAPAPAPPAPDPLAPSWRSTAPFGRADTAIPGPFDSRPLVKIAYDLTDEAPLPAEPVKLGDDWFVVRLEKRENATREAFVEDEQNRVRDALLARRRGDALVEYVRSLRRAADAAGALSLELEELASGTPTSPAGQ